MNPKAAPIARAPARQGIIEVLESRIAPAFGAVFSLSTLNGVNGFKILGEAAGDDLGFSVSGAGDVNGDGFADLLLGANQASPNGTVSGASYVVFGKGGGFSASLTLANLNGANGFKIVGEAAGDVSGISVSAAGDVNGDGFADILIGAFLADANGTNSGASYVVFGKADGFNAVLNLSSLNGANGFKIQGEAANDIFGRSVSGAGDVNGDGLADLLIGADGASPNGSFSGASYVVFGHTGGFSTPLNLSILNGTNGFKIHGEAASDGSGSRVSGAGDINGDGFADLLIGASQASPNGQGSGASYVVFGKAGSFSTPLNLSSLNGANGFKIQGEAGGDVSGYSLSAAGDVNGDSFPDLVIGALGAGPKSNNTGASYVVFGKAGGFSTPLNLSSLNGANGFKIRGEAANDDSGRSVSGVGDVNGDGFADLLIGAEGANNNTGASYVVFGKVGGFSKTLNLSSLNGTNGFKIQGEAAGDYSGISVSAAGDVNGDGFADLVIGANGANNGSGATFVLFGSRSAKSMVIHDGNGDPVTVSVGGNGFLHATLAPSGDIRTLDVFEAGLTTKFTITLPKNAATTVGHIIFAEGKDGFPQNVGSVKLGVGVLLGDGTIGTGPALEVTGGTKTVTLDDVNQNAIIDLGTRLPYDAPGTKTPDTYNQRPNVTIHDVLGPGVEIRVLGDGLPAGIGGGGLGKVTVHRWAFPGAIRTTQSIGSFRLLEGDFVGRIEIDKEHVGDLTIAGIQLVSIRGDFGGILTAEGEVGTFSAEDFPGTIIAGAMKTMNLKGAFSGLITLSSQTLGMGDLRDPAALFARLAAASDPVSAFLAGQLTPAALGALRGLTREASAGVERGETAGSILLADLNRLLNGASFFDTGFFGGVALSEATRALLESDARGAELIRLNRLLLGDAYRDPRALHLGPLAEAPPIAAAQTLQAADLNDPAALAAELVAHAKPESEFLWNGFSATQKRVLANPAASNKQLSTVLLSAFNSLLNAPTLSDHLAAKSPEAAKLFELHSADRAVVTRLNRLLLSDAFRDAALPFLGAFQEAPATGSATLNKVKVTGEFTGTLVSESVIKEMTLTNAFRGSVAASSIGKITAFSFDGGPASGGTPGSKSIEATGGALGIIKASSGLIANYHIDSGDQPFGGFAVTRSKLVTAAAGLENVSVVAGQIGKITVSLRADASTPAVVLTGIRNSTFESTVGAIGSILSSHAIEDSLFAAKTNVGGLKIKAGGLADATLLAGIDLGDDHAVGGAGPNHDTVSPSAISAIGAITIAGAVSNAKIGAGYDPTGNSLDSILGKIAALVITGPATGSVFATGKFTSVPKVAGVPIDPHTDPQFLTLPSPI